MEEIEYLVPMCGTTHLRIIIILLRGIDLMEKYLKYQKIFTGFYLKTNRKQGG